MSEQIEARPVVVFVPPHLTPGEVGEWRDSIIQELLETGRIARAGRETWHQLLDQAGSQELDEAASAMLLLVPPTSAPLYLWVTLAQPAGRPIELGEAVLQRQLPNLELGKADISQVPEAEVHQGYRVGEIRISPRESVTFQVCVTVATLTVSTIGDVDVCLWFGTADLDIVDELLAVIAGVMVDSNLTEFLAA